MSHRIIEKRRRDRMNNCLADLSRLIPAEYLKKGRGRVEKTEIIEMAIRHMKHLQGLRQGTYQSNKKNLKVVATLLQCSCSLILIILRFIIILKNSLLVYFFQKPNILP